MTEFVGTALADEAVTEENIVLIGFSGGSIADLSDAISDTFHGLAGDDRTEIGAGNYILDEGEGDEFPGPCFQEMPLNSKLFHTGRVYKPARLRQKDQPRGDLHAGHRTLDA
jgi:hypothetical protein